MSCSAHKRKWLAWLNRKPCARVEQDEVLKPQVKEILERNEKRYGSPRVHAQLRMEHQVFVSRKRVARLMQSQGLVARRRKRGIQTTTSNHTEAIAPKLLERRFLANPDKSVLVRRYHLCTNKKRICVSHNSNGSRVSTHPRLAC